MKPILRDALRYAIPVAAVIAAVFTVGSWYGGDTGWQNYAVAMFGAALGFIIGLTFGAYDSPYDTYDRKKER